jgi:hypothetical protein
MKAFDRLEVSELKEVYLPTLDEYIGPEKLLQLHKQSRHYARMIADLSSEDMIRDFIHAYKDLVCYANANIRTIQIIRRLAPEVDCGSSQGRGRPGYYYEFEVLFLYAHGYDTKRIAKLIKEVGREKGHASNLERIAARCVANAKKRRPELAFAAAVASHTAKNYGDPGKAEREAVAALRRLGLGEEDPD